MEKTVALIARRGDFTRDAFRDYFETRHAPLALRHISFAKYVRNHVAELTPESAEFDLFSEFWQGSAAAAQTTLSATPGAELREDKHRFQDESKQCVARTTERLLAGPARGVDPAPTWRQALFLVRETGTTADAFLEPLAGWGAGLHAAAADRVVRATLDAITPLGGARFPFDAVLSLWLRDRQGGLSGLAAPPGVRIAATAILDTRETPPEVLAANGGGA